MSINVVIECKSSGLLGGYNEQRAYSTDIVGSLIDNYCASKGIRREPAFVLIGRDRLLRESMKTLAEAGIVDGDHLLLVKRGNPSDLGINRWWVLCAIALTLGIVGLSTITVLYVSNVYPPFDYGIVFDAGSTHTHMYLYTWQGDKANGTGVVRQMDECAVTGGGIAAEFRNSPKDVVPYLEECLNKGISGIPEDRQQHSAIYLGATAGMRLLGVEDPIAESEILGNVSSMFKNTTLRLENGGVRTICGEEEALSGWVTVNYLSDTLTQARRFLLRAKREAFTVKTIGALDMGGASTQITFEVPPPDPPPAHTSDCGDDIKSLKLFGKKYYLYSKSFLCFGVQEFSNMYNVLLLNESADGAKDASLNVFSPCFYSGYSYTKSLNSLRSYCSNATVPGKFENGNITYIGTGNFSECQNKIKFLLDETNCKKTFKSGSCLTQVPQRNYAAAFSAFSSFGYIAKGLNITPSLGSNNFYDASKAMCESTWSEVKEGNYPGILEKYKSSLCIQSIYEYLLLKFHYNLSEDEWKKLSFSKTIDNTDVGWTLGFMINGTNIIPAEAPVSSILSLTGFIILGVFFVAFVALAAAIATVALRKARIVGARPLQRLHSSSGPQQRLTYGALDV